MAYSGPYPLPIQAGGTAQTTSPAFGAFVNAPVTNVTGNGTIYTVLFNTKMFDVTTSYSTSTGAFTAPVTGNYIFNTSLFITALGAANTLGQFYLEDNSTNKYYLQKCNMAALRSTDNNFVVARTVCIPLTAAASVTVKVVVSNGTQIVGISGFNSTIVRSAFSGYLLK